MGWSNRSCPQDIPHSGCLSPALPHPSSPCLSTHPSVCLSAADLLCPHSGLARGGVWQARWPRPPQARAGPWPCAVSRHSQGPAQPWGSWRPSLRLVVTVGPTSQQGHRAAEGKSSVVSELSAWLRWGGWACGAWGGCLPPALGPRRTAQRPRGPSFGSLQRHSLSPALAHRAPLLAACPRCLLSPVPAPPCPSQTSPRWVFFRQSRPFCSFVCLFSFSLLPSLLFLSLFFLFSFLSFFLLSSVLCTQAAH